jgi:tRNA (mo5U34)-methyltransferase
MTDTAHLIKRFAGTPAEEVIVRCAGRIRESFSPAVNRDIERWNTSFALLPEMTVSSTDLSSSSVRAGVRGDIGDEERAVLEDVLVSLMPWRKGPFSLFGIDIDCEWRSDLKWDRVRPHISRLAGRSVLDVGCGSGYHLFRMIGEGASCALGVEPIQRYVYQFMLLNRFVNEARACVLPLTCEDLPGDLASFDTVFSMGLLYHRRSPFDHLAELRSFLRPGGELVLETIVIDGPQGAVLIPQDRYAKMRNVWFLPSVPTCVRMLERAGFCDVRAVDVAVTTSEEQRKTRWFDFETLDDFLDPHDRRKTVEGYPAPMRAVFVARKEG